MCAGRTAERHEPILPGTAARLAGSEAEGTDGQLSSGGSRGLLVRRLARLLFALHAVLLATGSLLAVAWMVYGTTFPGVPPHTAAQALVVTSAVLCTAAAALLMSASQGWRRMLLLLALVCLINGPMEWLGTTIGFPSGVYTYTELSGPLFLGRIPYSVPLLWFAMLSLSLHVAFSLPVGRWPAALIASAMLPLWDAVLDPAMTGELALWTWNHAGGFYGVPLLNWVSWFLTTGAIVAVYLAICPSWKPCDSRLPMWLYGTQSAFVAFVAAMNGRYWATIVWAAGFAGLVALVYWGRGHAAGRIDH